MPDPEMPDPESIWSRTVTLDALNAIGEDSMVEHLGIRFIEVGPDFMRATMPVDRRTHQPFGLLHGGASVALAETLGSTAAHGTLPEGRYAVGLSINASHVRAVRSGTVTGVARPVHLGRSTQVWAIEVTDEEGRLVCTSRLTMAVLSRRDGAG